MRLAKITQVYLSIVSVFLLTLVGAGAYLYQFGSLPSSQADQNQVNIPGPVIKLTSSISSIKIGDEVGIDISGEFQGEPVTGAQILFSYPTNIFDVTSVDDSNGILAKATANKVDSTAGTVSLTFFPLAGYSGTGTLATVHLKSKATGMADLNLETISQLNSTLPTTVSTVSQISVTPQVIGTTITVE